MFTSIDWTLFLGFAFIIVGAGLWLARKDEQETQTAAGYFLAGNSLPWWAVGGSLIASNISAEQFIGMSGAGYNIGMAIASYEFMAAATLLLVAKFLLPIFLKQGIYTMPQFVEQRFDHRVRTGLAIFWIMLFVFVNITLVFYMGALTMKEILGVPLWVGVWGLVLYSSAFSIFGGLRTVVITDVIQLVVLFVGGLMTTYFAVNDFGGGGFWSGLSQLVAAAPEKFNMILEPGETRYLGTGADGLPTMKDAYNDLPGISVLIGGMWIANLYYWGMNQYIIQRALGAKNLNEAQNGILFAAFMKLLLPMLVVIPGIVAFAQKAPLDSADKAYAWILATHVPIGFKGLAFAALMAAVGSSISSMANSVSTIFTMDLYKMHIAKDATDAQMVRTGKFAAAASLLIGAFIASAVNPEQAFQAVQKYTGYLSPGVLVVFLFGLFWSRASTMGALSVVFASLPLSILIDKVCTSMPFMNQMGLCFVLLSVLMVAVSYAENPNGPDPKAISYERSWFATSPLFNGLAFVVIAILAAIYGLMW